MDINSFFNFDNGEDIFRIVDAVLFLIFAVFVLYLFIFAVKSTGKTVNKYPPAEKLYKFAILFPAYMEDLVIVNSVKSFLAQKYPRDKYDIYVISAEMKEKTDRELESLSATVIRVDDTCHTKIKALQKATDYIVENKLDYDVVVVLDADNVVDSDFLEQLNNAFYSGCSAVQTHRVAKNMNTSVAVLDAVSEEMNNSIFRKGHTKLGFSAGLIGSGMAFDYDTFMSIIYDASSIGEDKQLEVLLLKQNIYIEYLSDVHTYDEKVKKSSQFYNQRKRWLFSQVHNLFLGAKGLPKALFNGNWDYCNKLFQWIMPPRIMLLGSILIIACLILPFSFYLSIKWFVLFAVLCITLALAIPDYLVNGRLLKAIFYVPILFLLMLLNHFRIFNRKNTFSHTPHDE
ncbi:glycosyltransferase [Coprobacter tertius]|uniref:Glycosyltransferase family 2 protein n=1 Tax=Coprobacter tertius TaxID=2944915 RepID=A0ABT1MF01_9BACT|nr:glycosyltransferase family 2 protein [Coprobacter tertius]MCP9610936.1 glycosyltransferase family 2 protein [Coprobacter tertius]